jgi:hypothetical protein
MMSALRVIGSGVGCSGALWCSDSVRPIQVVVGLEYAQRAHQVGPVPDKHPVEQFAAAGADPTFHHRVHPRHPNPGQHDLNTGIGQYFVECGTELPGTVADQIADRSAGVLQGHGQVPSGLGDPRRRGVRRGAQDPDPAGGVFKILASLSRSLIGSSRNAANVFVTAK